ncbi:MAG: GNAT family N-acetyltransferase [Bacteroidales bacterium]|nr:GNAT family N-acetyltransferase [Bacteroidales bacterium]
MLENDQIYLRVAEIKDVDFLLQTENNSEYWHVSGTLFPYSRFELESFILNNSHDLFTEKQLRLMICEMTSDNLVGMVDLFDYHPMHRRAGVGIIVDEVVRHQGVASQALNLVCEYAKTILQLNQLYCEVQTDNFTSLKLFEKLGFVKIGVKKQWVFVDNQWKDVCFFQKLL